MLERLRNNVGLKLLSLLIALTAWAYLRFTPNPVIATARFAEPITVPITTTGLAQGEVAHLSDGEATLTVDVTREGGAVRPELIRASLNLAGRGPGTYNLPVQVVAPKLDVTSLSPASVTLTIERIEERRLPITVHYASENQHVVVGSVAISPPAATLRGPTRELERVVGLHVDVPLPSAPAKLDAMFRPVPIDVRGSGLAGIAVEPNLVRVRAAFVAASH